MSDETTDLDAAQAALDDARTRLADTPAEVVVTNHVMGLYELAAIHLSATPPDLTAATLAIDAVRALVETLDDRLGDESQTLRDALANIQMAYVEVKRRAAQETGEDLDAPDDTSDRSDSAGGDGVSQD